MSKLIGNTNVNLINVSNEIDLDSSSVIATSKAVKLLNDKIGITNDNLTKSIGTTNNKLTEFINSGQVGTSVPNATDKISNDLNNLTDNGTYFVYCTAGTTANMPVDLTGWYLIKNYVSPDDLIVQESQLHSITGGQPGYRMTRCRDASGTWGNWTYAYAQFAG